MQQMVGWLVYRLMTPKGRLHTINFDMGRVDDVKRVLREPLSRRFGLNDAMVRV